MPELGIGGSHPLNLDDACAVLAEDLKRSGANEAACARTTDNVRRHGDSSAWAEAVGLLPGHVDTAPDLNLEAVRIGSQVAEAEAALRRLMPWRKGPFKLHGITIDAEWRSDLKWNRLAAAVDFAKATVLDIGCGNFYYGWRALGSGAQRVDGIDPTVLFAFQYLAARLPLGTDRSALYVDRSELLAPSGAYSLVMSMGVLYHRRAPLDHLIEVHRWLQPGGLSVIETLVAPGDSFDQVLTPRDRYAGMRNVWFLPSVPTLCRWLERSGFADIDVVDVSPTTSAEQRVTTWSSGRSLADALDPHHPGRTVEGEPAPIRAMVLARRR